PPLPPRPVRPTIGAIRVSMPYSSGKGNKPSQYRSVRPAISRLHPASPFSPWLRRNASASQDATSISLVVSVRSFRPISRIGRHSGPVSGGRRTVGVRAFRLSFRVPHLGADVLQATVWRLGGVILPHIGALRRVTPDRGQERVEIETVGQGHIGQP